MYTVGVLKVFSPQPFLHQHQLDREIGAASSVGKAVCAQVRPHECFPGV